MLLSLNEIRNNAIAFSREWAGETRERAEKDSFWNDFFAVFGIKRKVVASYEAPVKMLSGQYGHIDLFWTGTFLAEHKSAGQSLDKAHSQAMDYVQALTNEGRHDEVPRYVAVCDYRRMALYDLEAETEDGLLFGNDTPAIEFALADFHQYVDYFRFIPGYKIHKLAAQNPVDIRAVELHPRVEIARGVGRDEQHRPRRTSRRPLGRTLPPRDQDSLRPSHIRLAQRSARQGPCPRRHRRLRPRRTENETHLRLRTRRR